MRGDMTILWRSIPLIGLSLLAACASPADPQRMIVPVSQDQPAFPTQLMGAMCVRSVTGGEDTNPLWVSNVGDREFREALVATMTNNALLTSSDNCQYPLDVNLLGLSQPIAGFDMEVTSHVNYKMYNAAGASVMLETINAPYTAKFNEAFVGIVRLQRANEGSIRNSISEFLTRLRRLHLE
jgi:hypothetical protein